MVLLVDNYDSFTYNLYDCLKRYYRNIAVTRNDSRELKKIKWKRLRGMVLSPGPCTPQKAGESKSLIRKLHSIIPVLGICLGHQSIGEVFGAKIVRAHVPMHGKTSVIRHDGKTIFSGIASPLSVMRYHSLLVERISLPGVLEVSAVSPNDEIMGFRHRRYSVEGVQFHPESILTQSGEQIIRNWINLYIRRS